MGTSGLDVERCHGPAGDPLGDGISHVVPWVPYVAVHQTRETRAQVEWKCSHMVTRRLPKPELVRLGREGRARTELMRSTTPSLSQKMIYSGVLDAFLDLGEERE